ncbi:MAG: HslU--HslV peptidase ATPase subunit [Spirochaetes bacterium GWC1_61_12]|nr:MAG: HslU--HslV peptidase ATPase subunit [Spirochaetes bacterium GWC1_61_12]
MREDFAVFTPQRIVEELDRHIVGQLKAKRAVAIALRNRLRRKLLAEDVREEIAPKNILMIGPTGVGKTEIARRLAKLCGAPFIKVEATKYTEVGYVGRDVESMIRDLMAAGFRQVMEEMTVAVRASAEQRAEERLLDLLLPGIGAQATAATKPPAVPNGAADTGAAATAGAGDLPHVILMPPVEADEPAASTGGPANATREKFRAMLRSGSLDARLIDIQLNGAALPSMEIFAGQPMEDLESAFSGIAGIFGGNRNKKKRSVTVKEARGLLLDEESERLVDKDKAGAEARERVEQSGIIFLDEIDKIAVREGRSGGVDVSREGVQRDILPIVEGSKVSTKHGVVDTTHILFIAAGAFTVSKPTDLIPELQGRFPIRVELEPLLADDFYRILVEPENALVKQYTQLLSTEGLTLDFEDAAVRQLAEICEKANTRTENIGARRLHTIMERLLEELSFDAPAMAGQAVTITTAFVAQRFDGIFESPDLAKFIL